MASAPNPIPPEIAGELDEFRRCDGFTIYGNCPYIPIRGENLCLEHSSSPRANRLRTRALAIQRRKLAERLQEHGEIAQLGAPRPGAFGSIQDGKQDGADGPQLRPPLPPLKDEEEMEPLEKARERYDALRWGEVAASYFALEDLCDMHTLNDEVRRERAKAAVREMAEIRREERAARERERRKRERIGRESEQPRTYFHGDLSTPYGLASAAEGVTRLYAEGRITQRRCDTIMKGLRLVVVGRLLGSARPIKFPALPRPERAIDNIVEADLRPYESRRMELKLLQNRFRSLMAARLLGGDLSSDAGETGNDVPVEGGEISLENKPDTSGSLTT